MRKVFVAGIVCFGLLAGCDSVNDETVKDMPTGYLCSMLDPNTWITSGQDRAAIFKELKVRDADCVLRAGTSKPAF
jgi:hypothetical protein